MEIAILWGFFPLYLPLWLLWIWFSTVHPCREWKHFNYQPRVIRFACQSENHQGKDVIGEINLPQFSAAIVPKVHTCEVCCFIFLSASILGHDNSNLISWLLLICGFTIHAESQTNWKCSLVRIWVCLGLSCIFFLLFNLLSSCWIY